MYSRAEFVDCAKRGDRTAVEIAIQADPELANATEDGVSALLWSVYYGHADIGRVIADAKGELDIFEAAALGDRHRLAELLDKNPQAHQPYSSDGFTALGLAAYFGHREVVQELLDRGADLNARSQNPLGVAPLHSALSNGHKEIARNLVAVGADVNAKSAEGWTPLHYAAHSGDLETARTLLDRGADVTIRRADGVTPAELALEMDHSELAALIQEAEVGGV